MICVVCARCHDSHKVVKAYSSRGRARIMADLGNILELQSVTRYYIDLARRADTDDEREHWAHAMLHARADGLVHWKYCVHEVDLS